MATLILGISVFKEQNKYFSFEKKKIVAILETAKKYKKFPMFNSWPSLFDSLRGALPVIFLSSFYGTVSAGYYSLAMRILWLPSSLLGSSISQVLFQKITEEQNEGKYPGR